MGTGGLPGGPRGRGRAPHPRGQGVGPLWYFLRSVFFIISKNNFRGVSGLLQLWNMFNILKNNKLQKYFPILKIVWNFTFCLSRICSTFLKIYDYCLRFFKNVPNSKNILVLAICSKVENNIYIKETHFRKKFEF